MNRRPTFILVGHCWADRFGLKSAVRRAVGGARIVRANELGTLRRHLANEGGGAVLLVNRALDGAFGTESGVELIRRLAAGDEAGTSILVSDYPETQAEAVEAGALPGFGKSQLRDGETADRLREAASGISSQGPPKKKR